MSGFIPVLDEDLLQVVTRIRGYKGLTGEDWRPWVLSLPAGPGNANGPVLSVLPAISLTALDLMGHPLRRVQLRPRGVMLLLSQSEPCETAEAVRLTCWLPSETTHAGEANRRALAGLSLGAWLPKQDLPIWLDDGVVRFSLVGLRSWRVVLETPDLLPRVSFVATGGRLQTMPAAEAE